MATAEATILKDRLSQVIQDHNLSIEVYARGAQATQTLERIGQHFNDVKHGKKLRRADRDQLSQDIASLFNEHPELNKITDVVFKHLSETATPDPTVERTRAKPETLLKHLDYAQEKIVADNFNIGNTIATGLHNEASSLEISSAITQLDDRFQNWVKSRDPDINSKQFQSFKDELIKFTNDYIPYNRENTLKQTSFNDIFERISKVVENNVKYRDNDTIVDNFNKLKRESEYRYNEYNILKSLDECLRDREDNKAAARSVKEEANVLTTEMKSLTTKLEAFEVTPEQAYTNYLREVSMDIETPNKQVDAIQDGLKRNVDNVSRQEASELIKRARQESIKVLSDDLRNQYDDKLASKKILDDYIKLQEDKVKGFDDTIRKLGSRKNRNNLRKLREGTNLEYALDTHNEAYNALIYGDEKSLIRMASEADRAQPGAGQSSPADIANADFTSFDSRQLPPEFILRAAKVQVKREAPLGNDFLQQLHDLISRFMNAVKNMLTTEKLYGVTKKNIDDMRGHFNTPEEAQQTPYDISKKDIEQLKAQVDEITIQRTEQKGEAKQQEEVRSTASEMKKPAERAEHAHHASEPQQRADRESEPQVQQKTGPQQEQKPGKEEPTSKVEKLTQHFENMAKGGSQENKPEAKVEQEAKPTAPKTVRQIIEQYEGAGKGKGNIQQVLDSKQEKSKGTHSEKHKEQKENERNGNKGRQL